MARLRKFLLFIIVLFASMVLGCFLFKDHILQWAFKKVQDRVHESYHARLTASSVTMSGVDHVTLRDITLQPDGLDTFLHVAEVGVKVSLMDLFRAKVTLDRLKIDSALFTIYNEEGRNNISFVRSMGRDKKAITASTPSGYREQATGWEAKLFRVLNTAFEAKNIQIHYQDSVRTESVYIPSFTYDLHRLSGLLINQKNADTVSIDGTVVKRKEAYQCTIRHLGNDTAYLPFLDHDHSLRCRFRSITADLKFDNSGEIAKVITDASLEDFHINHWRLAKEDVILPKAQFKGLFSFTDDAMEMDSSSVITLGSIPCHVFAHYGLLPDTAFTLALHMSEIAADSFFQSLPIGMFNTLKGISCSGTLAYDLTFAIHTDTPDSLQFYSALKQKNLHIQHFGADNYTRINSTFTYDAYEQDRLVRRLTVGSLMPNAAATSFPGLFSSTRIR